MDSVNRKTNSREDKVRQLRLFQILETIRQGKYPNAKVFQKKFEVSRSTIMRDIEFLKDRYEVPLEYSLEKRGYYLTNPDFTISSFLLTEGELFTLHIILPLVEQYKNTPLEPVFESIMEQMLEMLPKDVAVQSSFSKDQVHFISNPQPKINQKVFYTILDGIKDRRRLNFGYRSIKRQDYIHRKLDPYKVVCQRGDWYVIGFCHRHNEFRVYNMARVQDPQLGEEFVWDETFQLEDHIDLDFGVWTQGEWFTVELLFSKDVNTYILERQWHHNQECVQQEDGSVYLKFSTNQFDEVLHWVMSFGRKVRVLNPPKLREALCQEIDAMKKIY